jgi:DNA-binding response OmpR family regulator
LVLLVEGNGTLLEWLGRVLSRDAGLRQCRYALAPDALRARRWLDGAGLGLVVLDWRLPGAASLVAAVRAAHGPGVPVLALGPRDTSDAAERAGADALLRSPYFVSDLVGMVRALLDP